MSGRQPPETRPVELPTLTVSLAVEFVEGVTGGTPAEVPAVSIDGVDAEPEPKSDRFLLFLDVDLPEPPTTTVLSVDGGDRYRDVTREVVVVGEGDPPVPAGPETYPASEPVVTVWLFGEDDTVVRGTLRDGSGNRLDGGELGVTELGYDLAADVDANGRFVLYVEDPPDDGDLEAELETDGLDAPVSVTLPVVAAEETVRTLVVDVAAGTVTVEGGP